MGTIVAEQDGWAPTPDGSVLWVDVECRLSRTAEIGARHPVGIAPDWSLDLPHDLEAERVAAGFGGYVSCLELPGVVAACRSAVNVLARRKRVELDHLPGVGWRLREEVVRGCACARRDFPDAKQAAMHARSPMHVSSRAQKPEFLVATVLEALRLANEEFRPPPEDWQAAARWVREPKGLNELWAVGLPPSFVIEAAQDLELVEPHPVRFYLGLAFRNVDRDWLTEVLRHCPDPDVAAWLAWTKVGLDPRDPALLGKWLASGVGRADVEILTRSAATFGYVTAVAEELDWSVRTAATVVASWARIRCRPAPYDLKHLQDLGIGPGYRPTGPALEALVSSLAGLDNPPSRTHLAVMLAMAGSICAARDGVLAGARTPAALARLITEGDA